MIIMLIKYFVFFQVRVGYFLRKENRNQTAEKLLIKLLLLLQLLVYGHPPHGHIIVIASGDYKLLWNRIHTTCYRQNPQHPLLFVCQYLFSLSKSLIVLQQSAVSLDNNTQILDEVYVYIHQLHCNHSLKDFYLTYACRVIGIYPLINN